MKTWKILVTLLVLASITVGATLVSAYSFGWGVGTQTPYTPATVANSVTAPVQTTNPVTQTNLQTPTLYTPQTQIITSGYGTGLGPGRCMGRSIFGSAGNPTTGTSTNPLTISQATQIATTYVGSLNNADLKVTQVEEYVNNFYVLVGEKSTGNGAFELLINKYNGIITPEPGPNMMWNTKFTFGVGICNWFRGTITATPTVTADQAKADAQQYLNSYIQGTTTGDVTAFHGYFTVEVLSNGSPYGMLSVNAFTGQVWYHTWHGAFIQEQTVS